MERQTGILTNEKGILEKDGIYFASISPFAQNYLFYPMFGAVYTCDKPYRVHRRANSFDAFFLCFILEGEMILEYRGSTFSAIKNSVIFLDCMHAHTYAVTKRTRFYWIHFRGAASRAYADRMWLNEQACFGDMPSFETYFSQIHRQLKNGSIQEDLLSVDIHRILAQLCAYHEPSLSMSDAVKSAKMYIDQNFEQTISLDELAEKCSMSKFYLSREFRRETGYAPHEYLINVRLNQAKRLLTDTSDSVEDIAFSCCFCSSANFIRIFKKRIGITPNKFRELIRSNG